MITDIPTSEEFAEAGANALHLAWDLVMDLVRSSDERFTGADLDPESREEYWQSSQTALGNAFGQIQLAMELGLKGRIARVSPFILITTEHGRWTDAPFSDFRTLDATDLVRVHNAVATPPFDDAFRAFFDDVRRKRNRLMHSVPKDTFDAGTLIRSVLIAAEAMFGDIPWPGRLIVHEARSRISVLDGGDGARNRVMHDIELALDHLSPAEAKRFFRFDTKKRAYLCPDCLSATDRDYSDSLPALAQLRTKSSAETALICIVCDTTNEIERADCPRPECPGNVLDDEGTCLTCGR